MQASQYTWNGRKLKAVVDSVPVGETQDRRSRKLRQDFSNRFFHCGRERKLNPLPESELIGRILLDKSGKKMRK